MLYEYLRLFKYDGSNFTDLSLDNQEEASTLVPGLASTDFLYMAHNFPVTNFFLYLDTAVNTAAANLKVEYWGGQSTGWVTAVDLLDSTNVSGVPLAKSGNVQWIADNSYNWNKLSDSSENYAPTELQSLASVDGKTLYNAYWMRISYDADLEALTELKEITYAFTTTQELDNIDVEIAKYMPAFATGKTDWIPEIITASKLLIIDLKRLGLLDAREQVIRFDDVFMPATYKTLDLIYMNLGPSYLEKRKDIRVIYQESLDISSFTFDTDTDGQLDERELVGTIKRLVR